MDLRYLSDDTEPLQAPPPEESEPQVVEAEEVKLPIWTASSETQMARPYPLKDPYPHLMMDNFLRPQWADVLFTYAKSLKPEESSNKRQMKHCKQKFAYDDIDNFPQPVQHVFQSLTSPAFVSMVECVTGIQDLIAGEVKLFGAGFHKILPGGYLDDHCDFNMQEHKELGMLDRRVNLLVYLNKGWKDAYNGHLMMSRLRNGTISYVKGIRPVFNRAVMFSTTNTSVHGHPFPLKCPQGESRDSIALYYYTRNKGSTNGQGKPVCFQGDVMHSTKYYDSPEK